MMTSILKYIKFVLILALILTCNLISQNYKNPEYADLIKSIENILNNKYLNNTEYGISIYSLTNSKEIFSYNSKKVLTPASTTKLFTSFAFFQRFGKDYSISTDIYIDGDVVNGVLNGDLLIRGGGDALLSVNDIEVIADEIIKSGITKINGNIYGDGSLFDNLTERIEYSGDKELVQATPPISALSINKNIAMVLISSISNKSNKKNIQLFPKSNNLLDEINDKNNINSRASKPKTNKIANQTNKTNQTNQTNKTNKTNKKSFPAKKKITNKIDKSKNNKSSKPKIKKKIINKKYSDLPILEQFYGDKKSIKKLYNPSKKGNRKIIYQSKTTTSYSKFIKNPVLTTANILKERLVSGGLDFNGVVGEKKLSELKKKKKIISYERKITDLINYYMKHSDNYVSETVFKTLGALTKLVGSDAVSAQNIVLHYLDSLKFNCQDCLINDGSGISRRNKLSAESMTYLFRIAYNQPYFKALDSSLAIAAYDGTLGNRMWDNNTRKNLRGKTGTHSNVSALTGLVNTQDNELLTFAFVFNGSNVNFYKKIENELGILLANYKKVKY